MALSIMVLTIDLFLYFLNFYFICGLSFGVYFIIYGASKIDPLLAETKKRVRFLLIPGIVATWPIFFTICLKISLHVQQLLD